MKLREMVQEKIINYIEKIDIEELISDAFYDSNVDSIIEEEIEYAIGRMDFTSIIEEAVKEIVEDEIEVALEVLRDDFRKTINEKAPWET